MAIGRLASMICSALLDSPSRLNVTRFLIHATDERFDLLAGICLTIFNRIDPAILADVRRVPFPFPRYELPKSCLRQIIVGEDTIRKL